MVVLAAVVATTMESSTEATVHAKADWMDEQQLVPWLPFRISRDVLCPCW